MTHLRRFCRSVALFAVCLFTAHLAADHNFITVIALAVACSLFTDAWSAKIKEDD